MVIFFHYDMENITDWKVYLIMLSFIAFIIIMIRAISKGYSLAIALLINYQDIYDF